MPRFTRDRDRGRRVEQVRRLMEQGDQQRAAQAARIAMLRGEVGEVGEVAEPADVEGAAIAREPGWAAIEMYGREDERMIEQHVANGGEVVYRGDGMIQLNRGRAAPPAQDRYYNYGREEWRVGGLVQRVGEPIEPRNCTCPECQRAVPIQYPTAEAEVRAFGLLQSLLNATQRAQLDEAGWFEHHGKWGDYWIGPGWSGNVIGAMKPEWVGPAGRAFIENRATWLRFCIHPRRPVPMADHMGAQLLTLRGDEDRFLQVAVRFQETADREQATTFMSNLACQWPRVFRGEVWAGGDGGGGYAMANAQRLRDAGERMAELTARIRAGQPGLRYDVDPAMLAAPRIEG